MTNEEITSCIQTLRFLENNFINDHGTFMNEEHPDNIEKIIKFLKEKSWIPVSEGLPEDGQNVLFCDIDGDIMIGYHVKGRPDTHFSQDGSWDDIKNVRAWMPLHEPYKESEVEE